MFVITLILVCAAVAAYSDLRTRRIPNPLPAALLAGGLTAHALAGWQSAAISIAVFVGVFAAGTALFTLRLLGGGDVKLIAAAAAAFGWPQAVEFLLYTMIAGGILGLAFCIARGRVSLLAANLQRLTLPFFGGAPPAPITSAAGTMPYAVAIFAGAAAVAVAHSLGLTLRIFA